MPSSSAFVTFVDKSGVFQFASDAITMDSAAQNRPLTLNPTLAAGTYSGQIELHVCRTLPCTQELPGSPVLVPYSITLKSSTNLTALSRTPGIGEWGQHQANAAHTGYVPMTLDASKFTRRWRWGVPQPDGSTSSGSLGSNLHPVVISNDTLYVVSAGYFQNATLFALNEHDRTLRWKKDFGSIFSANPPSADAGAVYVATSGHQDTFMWAFDGATGAQKFRTPFNSQWEHYMAPTLANGAVYTNGGSYGGLLSFRTSNGAQNWFGYLDQYDQWTPAVDDSFAYAFMPNGLVAMNVADGSQAFVIADPNNAVQPYSINGAPMQIAPNRVVVINGPAYSSRTNRLVCFDTQGRAVAWSVAGSFAGSPAHAKGVIYTINGAQLEARSAADGSRLWAWLPDEASPAPLGSNYGETPGNLIVTDNLVFLSTTTKVYAVDINSHQMVWSFPKPGRLALSPNGVLYISTAASGDLSAGVYAINLR